jgi:hypothetical protein
MDLKRTSSIVAIFVLVVIGSVVVIPVEAKYWKRNYGHSIVVYENRDLPSNIRPYVEKVEFDLASSYRAGVRLYTTPMGREYCSWFRPGSVYITTIIARWIRYRPEWIGDRSIKSIEREIRYHWRQYEINIEYYYNDLPLIEKAVCGR